VDRSAESCTVYTLPTILEGLVLSIVTMICGASNEPRRPAGTIVGIGR
jgi:hypothetical protein